MLLLLQDGTGNMTSTHILHSSDLSSQHRFYILGSQLAKILITTTSTTAHGSNCSSRGRKTMLQEFSYPPDFSSPRHHDCVGDGGGQSDERGDVDGAAGPFWFNSVLSWRQISLQTQSRTYHLWFDTRHRKKERLKTACMDSQGDYRVCCWPSHIG